MKHRLTITLAAGLVAGALFTPAARAQDDAAATTDTTVAERIRGTETPRDIDSAKARAHAAIEKRFEALDRMRDKVNASDHIDPAHATALLADYDAAEVGLAELDEQIQTAKTAEELAELIPKIAEDYRVFLVIAPKTWEVIGSDTIVAAGDRIQDAGADLQAAIDRAAAAGFEVGEVQVLLDAALIAADDAVTLADPVAEAVIDLDATDWQDPAEGLLRQGRSDLQNARAQLRGVADDLKAAVEHLKEIVHEDV